MPAVTSSPPRLHKNAYHAYPTRLDKEREATGQDVGNLPTDVTEIGPWILGDMIGKGSSGRVKLGKHKYSGKIAAVKIISKNVALASKATIADLDAKQQKALQGIHREVVIMKLINHPCIMALYDLQETETEFYLALEYVEGGELFDYLVSRGRLPEPEALNYFKQILYGLDYCHRFNISHRDLKPENILLDKNMNIKIADFGMAALEVANGMLETSCGSPHYASPEIVAGKAYHGASSDIWSCGVVLYALLSGRLPFDHPDIRKLLQKASQPPNVKIGKFRMDEGLSPAAQDLIRRMLVVDPEYRITIREIFKHPFFIGPTNRIFINPPPPSLQELSIPLGAYERIESTYLENLMILFHKTRAETEAALRERNPNWEKAFLYLLRQYAERVRENYGEDGEDSEEYSPRGYGAPNAGYPPSQHRPEPDVFTDVTHAHVNGAHRSIAAPVKLSVPPAGRKRSATVSNSDNARSGTNAKVQFATPVLPIRTSARPSHAARANSTDATRLPSGRPTSMGDASALRIRNAPLPGLDGSKGGDRIEANRRASRIEEAHGPSHSREESGRRTRPPSVVGPRPNPPSPSKPTRPGSALGVRAPLMAKAKPGTPLGGRHLNPMAQAFTLERPLQQSSIDAPARAASPRLMDSDSVFPDMVLGSPPMPFRSVLSPDIDGSFDIDYVNVSKRWSEDRSGLPLKSGDHDRELARKSVLSPHAEPFILGSLGQPSTRPVRKGRPAPLPLNPETQPVSNSQPGTPMVESPRLGQQPKVTGWFANLFTFKPVFHVLYSTASIELTGRECTRVLTNLGIQVLKTDGQDILRCNVERFIDIDNVIITKPVKFRIEVRSNSRLIDSPRLDVPLRTPVTETIPRTPVIASPYPCVLVMTQEKGAHSTLKAVYARLRASWKLDALISPMPQTPILG